jgi:polyhydroxybutyrate depolymerase
MGGGVSSGGGVTGPGPTNTAGGSSGGAAGGGSAPSSSCAGLTGSRDKTLSLTHRGLSRSFLVHLPNGWDGRTPRPVVLNFHGRNSTPSQQILLSGMNSLSDREGFIAVHPQGIGNTWNAGACCGEAQTRAIDDVGFTGAVLDSLSASFCVDSRRVYATGLSNGGFMSHRLGCDLSSRIAAIAPVAGTNLTSPCTPSRAVPVLHFHGTGDAIVPYQGFVGVASVRETMSGWVTRNGCRSTSQNTLARGDVSCESWPGCRAAAQVQLCTISNGGHQWPGGFTIPGLGANTSSIDASAYAWAFFRQHSLP